MSPKLEICFTNSGRKQLNKITHGNQVVLLRIDRKIRELRANPDLFVRGLKLLNGTRRPVQYRFRIGKIRLVGYMPRDGAFHIVGIMYRKGLLATRGP